MARLRRMSIGVWSSVVSTLLLAGNRAPAAVLPDARSMFLSGNYEQCLDACRTATANGDRSEELSLLQLQSQLTLGRFADALKTYEAAVADFPASIRIRFLGRRVMQDNGQAARGDEILKSIVDDMSSMPYRYDSAADRATFGRVLLLTGADARRVLEKVYDPAKKADPTSPEPFLASGDLAIEKNDYALAAESFESAIKLDPANPDAYLGLARGRSDDPKAAAVALEKGLKLNPKHIDSLLFRADDWIDREAYAEAETVLQQVLAINPQESRAWAYRAVLAHLAGDTDGEKAARQKALSTWSTDPAVDFLIGLKLSQKYRFDEGRAYQQRALELSPDFLPAKLQLCQDLLRLGAEVQGWKLAEDVFKADPYNVLAFNLTTLRDQLAQFRRVQGNGVTVLMDQREADLYGPRVTDLIGRARQTLQAKYDVVLPDNVFIEIFPQQKDFAIRTFGLPGGAGYLGVCFGNVITINSPASRLARPANWEAVLWHEFCHTITLHKTKNKMPRWLSEGISVYEERQANATWGQSMNPAYREMILAGKALPVSKLSSAFLNASTPMDVQFAYFESSMVVRYIVDHFGADALNQVLDDLSRSVPINTALGRRTVAIDKLDNDFEQWLTDQANYLAPAADLSRAGVPIEGSSQTLADWNQSHPKNFWGLLGQGQAHLVERQWQAALVPLKLAAELYPTYAGADSPYVLMADAYRGLKDSASERAMLTKFAELNSSAVEARLRLTELLAADNDWAAVRRVALDVLAINPLIAPPNRYLARAAEALGDRQAAIAARRSLLVLDPIDASGQHYELARLLAEDRQFVAAKREVLQSLEETPRFRAAHRLLLDIIAGQTPTVAPTKSRANERN